jgi:hypothetical protein
MSSQMRRGAQLVAVVLASATAGCVESGVGPPARGPNPAAASATLALDLRNPGDARENLFGDAVLFTAQGIGVALALDGGSSRGVQDGYVDQVFVLQQQEPRSIEPRILCSAELFYGGRLLIVRAAGAAPLVFAAQGAGDPDPAAGWLPSSAAGTERFVGFGISRRTGAWGIPLDEVTGRSAGILLSVGTPGTDGEAGTCDSGGEGLQSAPPGAARQ